MSPTMSAKYDAQILTRVQPNLSTQVLPTMSAKYDAQILTCVQPNLSTQVSPTMFAKSDAQILTRVQPNLSTQVSSTMTIKSDAQLLNHFQPYLNTEVSPTMTAISANIFIIKNTSKNSKLDQLNIIAQSYRIRNDKRYQIYLVLEKERMVFENIISNARKYHNGLLTYNWNIKSNKILKVFRH